ncbi:MAG: DNA primase [Treponema sp.]|jgi:DNA primase|nr:DNA primase [Treponema sp.]
MRIAPVSVQEVKDRLDAVSVMGDYVQLERRSGGQYWGCCPFHQEKTPSFKVDPELKLYYCFGCHKGGSVIDFVMEMDKISYPETIELLARKSGVELVYQGGENVEAERALNTRNDDLYVLYDRLAGSFHHLLMEKSEGKEAKGYITDRGVSAQMIERFRLGYSPGDRSWLYGFLTKKGYSPELLAASFLFSADYPRSSFFSGRLMFPIADFRGRTVAFGARLLGGEGPKYINSRESEIYKKGQTLFALDLAKEEIRRAKTVYIAEGYLDVIALHQAGIGNAVAPLGTAFTDDQAKLLRRWADRVCLIFDSDDPGQTAAVKAILTCRKNGLDCGVVVPGRAGEGNLQGGELSGPPPKDPADILKYYGPEFLQKSVQCIINDFEYLMSRASSLFDISKSEGKARAAGFLFSYADLMDSEVSREVCLENIADALGIERQSVLADFRQYRKAPPSRTAVRGEQQRTTASVQNRTGPVPAFSGKPVPAGSEGSKVPLLNDELFLLAAAIVNHRLYIKLRAALSIEELEDPRAKELFIALEEWFRNSEKEIDEAEAAIPRELLSRINDEGLRNFVVEQAVGGAFSHEPESLIDKSVKQIKRKRLERRQREITTELRTQQYNTRTQDSSMQGQGGGRSLEDLLAEKVYIDTELHRLKEAN